MTLPLLVLSVLLQTADSTRSQWILANDTAEVDQTIDAWLVIPGRPANTFTRVTVRSPSKIEMWFRGSTETCVGANGPRRTTVDLQSTLDSILPVCLRPAAKQAFPILALVADSARNKRHLTLVSGRVTAVSSWRITPMWSTILGAFIALVAGLVAHAVQAWWDRQAEKHKATQDFALKIAGELGPELASNLRKLEIFIADPTKDAPPMILTESEVLVSEHGVFSFFDSQQRKMYLRKLQRLYDALIGYVRLLDRNPNDKKTLLAAAKEVRARYDEWARRPA